MMIHLSVFVLLFLAIPLKSSSFQSIQGEFRNNTIDRDKTVSMDSVMLSRSVDPSKVILLSWQPRVSLYRGLLSEEECDYLVSKFYGLREAQLDDGLSLDTDDNIARRIEEKISAWTFLPKELSESLRVLRVGPEDSKHNYNYFDKKSTQSQSEPLLATVVLYLSNVSQGGQLLFPDSKNKIWSDCSKSTKIVKPTRGNAIIFFNQHLNATPDHTSLHARCPVLEGEMWFATKLFYMNPIRSEKDVSKSSDCTDEDDNCPQWAAAGECQRNSVFMIGSPDYYGTCRKSCNVCLSVFSKIM